MPSKLQEGSDEQGVEHPEQDREHQQYDPGPALVEGDPGISAYPAFLGSMRIVCVWPGKASNRPGKRTTVMVCPCTGGEKVTVMSAV